MKNLYLDIDGVILTTKNPSLADDAIDLIAFITKNFHCYWLTTHCKGEHNTTVKYLARYLPEYSIGDIQKIQATSWETLKTEAIDFSQEFVWLEDFPFESEKMVLMQNNCLNSLITVNLSRKNELLNIISELKQMI